MDYLPEILSKSIVQAALLEDLGRRGDVTSSAIIDDDRDAVLHIKAREAGVLCGSSLAKMSFLALSKDIEFEQYIDDEEMFSQGAIIATVTGNAKALLAAERTALNFLTHLSGIATTTREIANSIAHTKAKVTCTRKTIPGLRALQKYAVRVGGGRNHRMGLDDAILIKDNHIALSGESLINTVNKAIRVAGHLIPVEVEVDTLEQLEQVLQSSVSLVLLDNMPLTQLQKAVEMCQGRCLTEASGGLTPQIAIEVAETGVDFLAMGYLTHSPRYLDIGLDYIIT